MTACAVWLALAGGGVCRAAADTAAGEPAAGVAAPVAEAPSPQAAMTVEELEAERERLQVRSRELTQAISRLERAVRDARQRALATDPELRKQQAAIEALRQALEARLREKDRELAAALGSRDKLLADFSEVDSALKAVRAALAEKRQAPARP